ncbi:MAG: ABC transporter ATP-binding protein [Bacteroidetes bacterium]|nr:MAG: ABC transporter ATP-binding protein [Bacteroidota bacterium]
MLKLTEINRRLGDFALKDINLEVSEGQYYVLLGRSGSGKTQLLELIAGLEHPDSGTIFFDNLDITRQRIQDRKIGIVFQDYAVFPHMTVFGNIAYPLKARKEDKKSINAKVEKAAADMNIKHLLGRNTEKLSGGELQRVALARTLITSPRLLLLDEPLSSLDTSLKDDLKRLLRNLNKAGQTIIHVTHDYADAISLAKRVGVIHNGRIIQEGSIGEVFNNPSNRFVARYAGIRNFFKVEISGENGMNTGVTFNNVRFKLNGESHGKEGLLLIKSDSISLTREMPHEKELNAFKGMIMEIIPSEFGMEVTVNAGDLFYINIQTSVFEELRLVEGEEVWMSIPSKAIVVLNGNV